MSTKFTKDHEWVQAIGDTAIVYFSIPNALPATSSNGVVLCLQATSYTFPTTGSYRVMWRQGGNNTGGPFPPYTLNITASAGTTIGPLVNTIPTIGFNVETVEYKNISFTMWDVGGQDKIRRLWKHYYIGTDAVIFVVDSNDRQRVETAREELHQLMEQTEMEGAHVLVFANKQDLPNAMSAAELTEKLQLSSFKRRQWYIQGACATTGDGLYEGMDWLSTTMRKSEQRTQSR